MLLETKNTYLRLIEESDLDFLLSLRLNTKLSQYLSPVSSEAQIQWLHEYKIREERGLDFYFVIVDKQQGSIGFVRVYNINYNNKTFTWGSWVIREDRPKYAAVESFLLSYEFVFFELGLNLGNFFANNNNSKAIDFYNRFGASFLYKDDTNHFFELSKIQYLRLKYTQYYKFLLNS